MKGLSAPFKLLLFPLLCQMEAVFGVDDMGVRGTFERPNRNDRNKWSR